MSRSGHKDTLHEYGSSMSLEALNHGISGLVLAYVITGVPMLIGLLQQSAPFHRILTSPLIAMLVTLAGVIAWTIIRLFWSNTGALPPASVVYWTGTIFLAAFGYTAGTLMGKRHANTAHHRGTVIEEGRPTRAHPDALSLAGVAIPTLDETKHFKLIGTTGTGKSTAIRELLEGALARGDRAIVTDPDGGYLQRFYDRYRGDVILNPFEP